MFSFLKGLFEYNLCFWIWVEISLFSTFHKQPTLLTLGGYVIYLYHMFVFYFINLCSYVIVSCVFLSLFILSLELICCSFSDFLRLCLERWFCGFLKSFLINTFKVINVPLDSLIHILMYHHSVQNIFSFSVCFLTNYF